VRERSATAVDTDIKAQGDKVRVLKGQKADKAVVDAEVKRLLELKAEFKSLTGEEQLQIHGLGVKQLKDYAF
jgi:bifunctional glutamyl/prolyl-tRNA synthetase